MSKVTPMMQQYMSIKERHKDAVLLFRLGDFYELFFDDAVEVSRILQLTLTKRHDVPMCGVPFHALEGYLARLTKFGKKVAICEQLSDPALPGIVKRDVVRIVTPGTTFSESVLDSKANNFVIGIVVEDKRIGLAYADITTGVFNIMMPENFEELHDEIVRLQPAECVVDAAVKTMPDCLKRYDELPVFPHQLWHEPLEYLSKHFGVNDLKGFGLDSTGEIDGGCIDVATRAAALLLDYLCETQKSKLEHMQPPKIVVRNDGMILDETAVRNLELMKNLRDGTREGSLINVIDESLTAVGARMLRQWLLRPLHGIKKIEERLDSVEEVIFTGDLQAKLPEVLKSILDLERLMSRLTVGAGNARDMLGVAISLRAMVPLTDLLASARSHLFTSVHTQLKTCAKVLTPLCDEMLTAVSENPPLSLREGGLIRDGYDSALDALKKISLEGKTFIQKLQTQEVERTGINSLKIRFNQVFGYYIEITRSNLKNVPEDYIRKQTLSNCERYITPELKEYEETVLGAEEKMKEMEYRLFLQLREKVKNHIVDIQKVAQLFGQIDSLFALANVALRRNYVRPKIGEQESSLSIVNGRHPVVETMAGARFVPNDTQLDKEKRLILLTGPNMGGKSTWLRQTALITLLAHVGSFVPADEASIPLTDRIFTRIGASDNLVRGQSTFMVEMQETAQILHYATANSLIILDEIGRGTSTYDGVSLAWAILEYIHDKVGAKTLFATHYHELVNVAERLPHAINMSVSVKEERGEVVFLHRIQVGAISKSYGVEVARLAGVPTEIVKKAKDILRDFEEGIVDKAIDSRVREEAHIENQLNIFDEREHRALKELDELDVDMMTPIDALNKLHEMKGRLDRIEKI